VEKERLRGPASRARPLHDRLADRPRPPPATADDGRLVKGAYWDSEIKRAQLDGLEHFRVFTGAAI